MAAPRSLDWIVLPLIGLGLNLAFQGPAIRSTILVGGDFIHLYTGARLALSGKLYDRKEVTRIEVESTGYEHPALMPVRLPFYYVLLWPLSKLPYLGARLVWGLLCLGAAMAFFVIWRWPG